jgi:hypothetical protein
MIDWGFRRSQSAAGDWPAYDLLGQAALLTDESQQEPIERAMRSQAFRFAIHCPHLTTLESNRTFGGYGANYCEDNLRITAALFQDFYWYHSRDAKFARKKANTKQKRWLVERMSKAPGSEAVQAALHLRNCGLRPLIDGVTTSELSAFWESQYSKSKAVAAIIDGYMTAGAAISRGGRAPYGLSIMIEALVAERILEKSSRTIETYYAELEGTAVLHYLIHTNGVSDYFGPVYPAAKGANGKDFSVRCMDSSVRHIDARKIFVANNVVATYLNRFFGFQFILLPVRYLRDHYFDNKFTENRALADRIKAITGHTS